MGSSFHEHRALNESTNVITTSPKGEPNPQKLAYEEEEPNGLINLTLRVWLPNVGLITVVMMLNGESSLPQPKMLGFYTERDLVRDSSLSSVYKSSSTNNVTISQIDPR
ncbi:hypothetical protein QN277_002621 [Acacia crassicarpa]|uniref:S-locus receptor kinase C-terminal domain-containing protein n=1 Tax=Acacia crassicarpa TaxID=499986 RepID=A0AAE1N9X4_9FABA|nr:hypothetical protein QN277_002621 [Acacia crassicarpa]